MKRIMYYLLDENENKTTHIRTGENNITVFQGNRDYLTQNRACGIRSHVIYVDARLNTIINRDWIDEMLKPMCNLRGAEGIIFI